MSPTTTTNSSEGAGSESAMATAKQRLHEEIVTRVREALPGAGLDVVLPTSPENLAYTAGVTPPSMKTVRSRHAACLLPQEGDTEQIVVSLEGPLVAEHSQADRTRTYEEFTEDPMAVFADALAKRGLADARVGVELSHLPVSDFERLRSHLPEADLVAADEFLAARRRIKTPGEIAAIRDIGVAAERIADEAFALVEPGMSERELAEEVRRRYRAVGGDNMPMLVVGSGERSQHVNAPPADKEIARGDVIRLDMIGTKGSYFSDCCRTAVVGEPTAEQREIYGLLLDIHNQSIDQLRPGVETRPLYRNYRQRVESAGLPPYHFLGHGLGLTLHEEPYFAEHRSNVLEAGMVLAIEPIALLPGRFGMQVEDEIIITEDGCEPITRGGDLTVIPA